MLKILILTLLAPFLIVPSVMAASTPTSDLFSACNDPSNQSVQNSPVCKGAGNTSNPVIRIIRAAANIVALLTGMAAVIVVIVSGLTFITSGGNAEQVTASRRRILFALIALAIVALAWTLTRFITDKLIQ
jgi:hypothetical protein